MLASFKSKKRCRGTQVLCSGSPLGPFLPITEFPVTSSDRECLDGTLYVDKNGGPHLVFCQERAQIGDGTVCEITLSKDLKTACSEPRLLWRGSDFKAVSTVIAGKEAYVTDGPFFHRGESGELFCIWSTFTNGRYCECAAKSENGDIDGSRQVLDTPVFADNGGHGMIFRDFDKNLLFIFHSPNSAPNERPVICRPEEKDGTLKAAEY